MDLTIGIPTWNGANTIKATMESVLRSISEDIRECVEIVVSDNGSTDSTADMIMPYLSCRSPRVTYSVNEANVGFDRNVNKVMRLARGKFVWLLSDDDEIVPGAIDKVLAVISKHPQVGAIFVNYRSAVSIRTDGDRLCRNGEEFFHLSHFKSGLVSSNVFNTERWRELNLSRYFGCGWIHFAYLVEGISNRPAYIIAQRYVIQGDKWKWAEGGKFLRTGLMLVRVFRNMERLNYSEERRREADFVIKGGYPANIVRAKLMGVKVDTDLLKDFCELYHRYPTFWFIDLPLLLMPKTVYRSIGFLTHAIKGIGRRMQKVTRKTFNFDPHSH